MIPKQVRDDKKNRIMKFHQFFFFLTLVFLPTQLGFHFWPDWAMVMGRRLDYLSPTLYLTDITIFLTLSFWLFSSLKIKNLKLIKNYKFNIKNYLLVVLVLLVLIGLFVLALPYFQTLTPTNESVFVRNDLNSSAIKMSIENFRLPSSVFRLLIGSGLNNFLVRLPEFTESRQIFFLQPVHNIYLLLLSETGIIGLCLFVYMIIITVKKRWEKNRISCLVPLVSLLLLGLVDHYPLTLQQGQLLLTLLLAWSYSDLG